MTVDLVLGLGNPGARYAHSRHNAGFDVTAELLKRRGSIPWMVRPEYELAVIVPGRPVVLARPLKYMNRSGEVAESLLAELGLHPGAMLVVVDDIDLPLGTLRLKAAGGPGTHNGLRDICEHLGTAFPRLRVGIRGTAVGGDLADYVLSTFDDDETELARAALHRAAEAVESVFRFGIEKTMSVFNRPPRD